MDTAHNGHLRRLSRRRVLKPPPNSRLHNARVTRSVSVVSRLTTGHRHTRARNARLYRVRDGPADVNVNVDERGLPDVVAVACPGTGRPLSEV